jgi:leucyl/phenylalanyl-tRNA--protein transferase
MPVFELRAEDFSFPSPHLADPTGLLAVGGDLSPERILEAYRLGIFPWFSENDPLLWWSPDPRLVLFPDRLRVSRSLRQKMKKGIFRITFDHAFHEVIRGAADVHRKRDGGTWITSEMIRAYTELHRMGYAHSVESWMGGELVGGLYGVSLGSAFFGESMFTTVSDASKVAFVTLVDWLRERQFTLIDCQVSTEHLHRFGAEEIPRTVFLRLLETALGNPTLRGRWSLA